MFVASSATVLSAYTFTSDWLEIFCDVKYASCSLLCILLHYDLLFLLCALFLSPPYLICIPVPTLPFSPLFSSNCSGLHLHVDICCIYAIQLPCDCSSLSATPAQLAHSDNCSLLGCICLA